MAVDDAHEAAEARGRERRQRFVKPVDGGPAAQMSLRDYFAAEAMAALLSRSPGLPGARLAGWAFGVADAMVAARGRSGQQ